jgi:LysM repeat protein
MLTYEVKAKETLFGLSKQFQISQQELLALNPELADGVREGMVIKVPLQQINKVTDSKVVVDLSKNRIQNTKKEMVLLLPFNISKIQSDTTLSTQARLKKDGFLNMTLDFYSGALMAIDSAKRLGMNVEIKIFDSQETRNSSQVTTLIQSENLKDADVVIGPFYPQHVEKAAQILQEYQVPVISPLRYRRKSVSCLLLFLFVLSIFLFKTNFQISFCILKMTLHLVFIKIHECCDLLIASVFKIELPYTLSLLGLKIFNTFFKVFIQIL